MNTTLQDSIRDPDFEYSEELLVSMLERPLLRAFILARGELQPETLLRLYPEMREWQPNNDDILRVLATNPNTPRSILQDIAGRTRGFARREARVRLRRLESEAGAVGAQ